MHELLNHVSLFQGLSPEHRQWLLEHSTEVELQPGERLFGEGDPGEACYVVLEGEVEVTKHSGGQDVVLATRPAGAVLGETALLVDAPRMASVRAVQATRLLRIGDDVFQQLLDLNPSATRALLRTVAARLQQTEALLRQNEKMAALGTLAAGLAHELNNPAAAARRAASQLDEALQTVQLMAVRLSSRNFTAQQSERLAELQRQLLTEAAASIPGALDPLTQSDREAALETWLEAHGVAEAWTLSSTFVAAGLEVERLQPLVADVPSDARGYVLAWLAASLSASGLLGEVRQSLERVSQIVKAVKEYSYLDQAPVQEVDVHAGLENTLVILRHKMKDGIRVMREYDPELPRITAYASELNQVWTNLIDNAVDAMHGQGTLRLRTAREDGRVLVEVGDDGPGIPEAIQARIFEPFFTTKAPGEGTGLGLHISYSIVQRHRGELGVVSKPGDTRFQVRLPMQLAAGR